ncbi:MAG: DNA polymerase III subunit alpha [Candidatus Omnitrophica bacterium]|nr:DNA polymerase III subunit alpha [Candidatus Omnitrophota bacterium]
MTDFTHLHVHSTYSPMRGTSTVTALLEKAQSLGQKHLALTDTNGLYGAVRFVSEAQNYGIRPLLGAELITDHESALALIRNEEGYSHLCQILSDRHADTTFSLIQALERWRGGLVIISDCEPLLRRLCRGSRKDLYAELSPGYHMHAALSLAAELRLPPVATNRVHFAEAPEYSLHRLLRAIDLNTTLSELPESELCLPTCDLKPLQTLAPFYDHAPQALSNTQRIAQDCMTEWDFPELLHPSGEDSALTGNFEMLKQKTYAGAQRRYGKVTPEVFERVHKEFDIIRQKHMAPYFLTVEDVVRHYPITCGRGSAASSIVAYCLGVTHVDPIAHKLFLERFINLERLDPPDIDVDFPWDERDNVLDRLFWKYSSRRTAMVCNHITFKARSAIREVAKVYGIPEVEIARVTKRISSFIKAAGIHEHLKNHPLCRDLQLKQPWPEILRYASQLGEHLQSLSLHCGGVLIFPEAIRKRIPVEVSRKGIPLVQWEKDQCEQAGLFKLDILGNRSLAVIRDALALIQDNYGTTIPYAQWNPLEDTATQELIRNGNTFGCFYAESPAMRQLLAKMRRGDFGHMVLASSIIRPAANAYIQEFVRRLRTGAGAPPHPLLKEVLEESYGIAVYQEHITQIAMILAGFKAAEGEELRKTLSKKHRETALEAFRQKFFHGAKERGLHTEQIKEIWRMILSFSGYSFCKAHSASYSLVTYKTVFLKAHYPAEFMACVISNQGGYYSAQAYLSECRRMGLQILLPHINESVFPYSGKDRTVRVGFMQIQGVRRQAWELLLEERSKNGAFRDFENFLGRTHFQAAEIRTLIKAGCFDCFNLPRPRLVWQLYEWMYRKDRNQSMDSRTLFDAQMEDLPAAPELKQGLRLQHERAALGLLASCHPMELYPEQLKRLPFLAAAQIHTVGNRSPGTEVQMAGMLVTGKLVSTKHGEPMEFLTFEDSTGIYDATFFPQTYRRFCRMLTKTRPFVLRGKLEPNYGVVTLTVKNAEFLD